MDTFDEWKNTAIEYLHSLATKAGAIPNSWDFILGDDEDMRRDGFDENQTPQEYVDYQIECAQ